MAMVILRKEITVCVSVLKLLDIQFLRFPQISSGRMTKLLNRLTMEFF